MTLVLELPPKVEAALRELADREGVSTEAAATQLITELLAREAEDFEDAVAGIQRGLDAGAAGRERRLEEILAERRGGVAVVNSSK
jgi:predicted transcriptional regulator